MHPYKNIRNIIIVSLSIIPFLLSVDILKQMLHDTDCVLGKVLSKYYLTIDQTILKWVNALAEVIRTRIWA